MTDTQPRFGAGHEEEGRPAAFIVWALYLLSIPSANLLVIVGLVVAYAARSSAAGLPRQHMDAAIRLFWQVFWWTVILWVLIGVSFVLSFVLVGIPFLLLFGALWFVVSLWFTVKSLLALLNLIQDRPA